MLSMSQICFYWFERDFMLALSDNYFQAGFIDLLLKSLTSEHTLTKRIRSETYTRIPYEVE